MTWQRCTGAYIICLLAVSVAFGPNSSTEINPCFVHDLYDFQSCCSTKFRHDTELVYEWLASTSTNGLEHDRFMNGNDRWLRGNPECFNAQYGYDNCCTLTPRNGNPYLPLLYQLVVMIGMPSFEQRLFVVQHSFVEPGIWNAGGGLGKPDWLWMTGVMWATGYHSALHLSGFKFPFPTRNRRFLELAAGTGVSSLVALAMGFHVTTTDGPDAMPAVEKGVGASVNLTFGSASETLQRFRTHELDLRLLNASSPQLDGERFDVVLMTNFDPGFTSEGFSAPYIYLVRDICRRYLSRTGLALFYQNPTRGDEMHLDTFSKDSLSVLPEFHVKDIHDGFLKVLRYRKRRQDK